MYMFEWDDAKDRENVAKHGLSFYVAQRAFFDSQHIVLFDRPHSNGEKRYFCIGDTGQGIATVRFTMRGKNIRIFGAGYWRKGKRIYEEENSS